MRTGDRADRVVAGLMIKEGYRSVPVPVHPGRDIAKGLLSALEKQTGVNLANR